MAGKEFLARIPFWAFPAVAGAVVVDVSALLQFAHEQAAAMAAMHYARVCEIVFHLSSAILGATIQQFLDALPTFAAHQRLVRARIRCPTPIEIAHVQAFP